VLAEDPAINGADGTKPDAARRRRREGK